MSPSTLRNAERQLELLRQLYNAALQERRDAWAKSRVTVTYAGQTAQITEIRRADPEYRALDCQATHAALRYLDRAFKAFFERAQRGEAPGYPRFKGKGRYDSTTYRQTGWTLEGRRLTLAGIGTLRLFLSRPVEGKVKSVTLKRDRCGDWWVTFCCDGVEPRPLPATGAAAGLDLGLASFLATSDGDTVENPRFAQHAAARLACANRRMRKAKLGGARFRARVRTLARVHRYVRSARRDFHFKTARDLVRRYDFLAVEALNFRGLSRGMLRKSVYDAGWCQFLEILRGKAESAGRVVVAVNPGGTSQMCSGCGYAPAKRKTLKVRVHQCEECGLRLDRDVNAARNILALAKRGGERPAASCPASKAAA